MSRVLTWVAAVFMIFLLVDGMVLAAAGVYWAWKAVLS